MYSNFALQVSKQLLTEHTLLVLELCNLSRYLMSLRAHDVAGVRLASLLPWLMLGVVQMMV